jgi:hypothetical protein
VCRGPWRSAETDDPTSGVCTVEFLKYAGIKLGVTAAWSVVMLMFVYSVRGA